MSNHGKKAWRLAIGVLVIVAIGYLSNCVSTKACERQVARWIAKDIMNGRKFFVLPDRASRSLSVFKEVGARVEVYTSTAENFNGFPWGEVGSANFRWPFVVTVKWGYVQEPLGGHGGVRRFICFFGYPLELGNASSWSA